MRIITDRDSGLCKGFCFIGFANKEMASAAKFGMDGYKLDGKTLTVRTAGAKDERPPRGDRMGAVRGPHGGFGGPPGYGPPGGFGGPPPGPPGYMGGPPGYGGGYGGPPPGYGPPPPYGYGGPPPPGFFGGPPPGHFGWDPYGACGVL